MGFLNHRFASKGMIVLVCTLLAVALDGVYVAKSIGGFQIYYEPSFSIRQSSGSILENGTITIASFDGFDSSVSLSSSWVGTEPSGITYSYDENLVTPPVDGKVTMNFTLTASPTASTGAYTLRITGTGGGLSFYTDIGVVVPPTLPIKPFKLYKSVQITDELAFQIEQLDIRSFDDRTSIALDSNDYPHIVYPVEHNLDDSYPIDMRYAHYNGSFWIFETIDSINTGTLRAASLDLDSNGYPHISYLFEPFYSPSYHDAYLKYAFFNGNSSIIQVVDKAAEYIPTSISVDSQNNPHILYLGEDLTLKYAHYSGSSWSIQTIDSNGAPLGRSIALDSNDNPHIAYEENLGPNADAWPLKYAHYNGSSWNYMTVDSENLVYWASIALDYQNNPHISYSVNTVSENRPRGIKYAYFNGTLWDIQKVPGGDNGYENSIALDSEGRPHISYLDWTAEESDRSLSHTSYNGTSWATETVDSDANLGWGNSIALDSGDFPHISYVNVNDGHLRYAHLEIQETLPTDLIISLSSGTSYVGFVISINGRMIYNGTGTSGVNILLEYSVTGGDSWEVITSATTSTNGDYSVAWMPSATGNYIVRASWAGDAFYPDGALAEVNLSVIPLEEQYVFAVSSNSTISNLAFDSTNRELSFAVSGPSGTTGYVAVNIAKELISNIADLKVYLDGQQLSYTVASRDDSWRLYFAYQHSTHTVTVALGALQNETSQIPIYIIIVAVAIAGVTILLFQTKFRRFLRK